MSCSDRVTAVADSGPAHAATADDPIVIVGMACRYPGGVGSPEELWQLVAEGRRRRLGSSRRTAAGTWSVSTTRTRTARHDLLPRAAGSCTTPASSTPAFFGIVPREALATDPQQRLLLETSWEALERAGIDPGRCGQPDRCVRRLMSNDYAGTTAAAGRARGLPRHRHRVERRLRPGRLHPGPGGPGADGRHRLLLLPGRPAPGGAGAALGGVRAGPGRRRHRHGHAPIFVEFSRQRGLAADGRCKPSPTRRRRHGLGRGRRRAGARAASATPGATATGCWPSSAGPPSTRTARRNGLTAPNGPAQQRVIRQALATPVWRPRTSTRWRRTAPAPRWATRSRRRRCWRPRPGPAERRRCWLGSVKSNIGHTQAAAGVAGMIKMVWRCGTVAAAHPARGRAHLARGLGRGRRRAADRGRPWPRDRHAAPCRRLLLRHQRHQRPHHRRAAPAAAERRPAEPRAGTREVPCRCSLRHPAAPAGPGRPAAGPSGEAGRTPAADVAFSLATHPCGLRPPAGVVAADRDACCAPWRRCRRAATRPWSTAGPPDRQAGVPVHRAGQPAARSGT